MLTPGDQHAVVIVHADNRLRHHPRRSRPAPAVVSTRYRAFGIATSCGCSLAPRGEVATLHSMVHSVVSARNPRRPHCAERRARARRDWGPAGDGHGATNRKRFGQDLMLASAFSFHVTETRRVPGERPHDRPGGRRSPETLFPRAAPRRAQRGQLDLGFLRLLSQGAGPALGPASGPSQGTPCRGPLARSSDFSKPSWASKIGIDSSSMALAGLRSYTAGSDGTDRLPTWTRCLKEHELVPDARVCNRGDAPSRSGRDGTVRSCRRRLRT
jgi:hypothetical protein